MSILNEFFYGNLTPYEYRQSKETKTMNAKVLDDEEALIGNLPESEQAQYPASARHAPPAEKAP